MLGPLGVALGDMDTLHADLVHQRRPFLTGLGLRIGDAGILGDVQERLLDEPGHHAGIGAAARHRGRAARRRTTGVENVLPQRVVGAVGLGEALVEVEAGPGLGHGVDVERAEFAAELEDVARRGVDREVHAEALTTALGEKRGQDIAVVFLRQRHLLEAQAVLLGEILVRVGGLDHREAVLVVGEMPLDQGKRAATDRTEADHHDRTGDVAVDGPILLLTVGHVEPSSSGCSSYESGVSDAWK